LGVNAILFVMGISYDEAGELACLVLGVVAVVSAAVGLVVRRRRRK
jgi:hypothetical protein